MIVRRSSTCVLSFAVVAVTSIPAVAESGGADQLWGIKIRRSAQMGSDDASKPAALSYTAPSDGSSSYAADVALSRLFYSSEHGEGPSHRSWETSAFIETHKNTLGSKKQAT